MLNIAEKSLIALLKVVRQQFVGEVDIFIFFSESSFFQDAAHQKLLKFGRIFNELFQKI